MSQLSKNEYVQPPKQDWEIKYQREQAEKLGLGEALPSIDAFPELKRMMEVFMVSFAISQNIYKTVKGENDYKVRVLDDKAFKTRIEREFFEIFQGYIDNSLNSYVKRRDTEINRLDNRDYLMPTFAALISLTVLFQTAFGEIYPKEYWWMYAFALFLTVFAVVDRRLALNDYRKSVKDDNPVYKRNFSFEDFMHYKQFVGEGAPLRMISDFYAVAQALYKGEKEAKVYLESSDAEMQAKGRQMSLQNRELAQKLVKFATTIEVRLRSGDTAGQPDKAFDSFVRLQQLAGETENEDQQLAEFQKAMQEVNEMLAGLPQDARIADASSEALKPRIVAEEFGIEEEEEEQAVAPKVLQQER